jgi:6,7-dimethyl-8-ribityllumazine synthase
MYKTFKYNEPEQTIESFPIAIVASTFFRTDVSEELIRGAKSQLTARGFKDEDVCWTEVPGVFEIPHIARLLAKTNRYEAMITLGAISIDEAGHFDWAPAQMVQECHDISKEYNIPVIFGIVPSVTREQAWEVLGTGKCGHRGKNSVDYAIIQRNLAKQIQAAHS